MKVLPSITNIYQTEEPGSSANSDAYALLSNMLGIADESANDVSSSVVDLKSAVKGKVTSEITWQNFDVSYQFPVGFTEGLFDPHNPVLREAVSRLEPHKQHRLIVFVDQGVLEACPELVEDIKQYVRQFSGNMKLVTDPLSLPGGEQIKSDWSYIEKILLCIATHNVDRHAYVVGIGGGAFLDAVGLAAATAHRGIRHIRIPTTVLAQNDSAIGVKNGVNYFDQKNYLGTFAPPFAVLNDYDFIKALPVRDQRAGMAEAVKVALIRDAEFFMWLEHHADRLASFDDTAMRYMIKRCAELHIAQIGQGGDPFETGSARPLDFGHWSAHKLETLTGYALRHGEAVAIGIALDSRYSVLSGWLVEGEEHRVCNLLEKLGFALWHSALEHTHKSGELAVLQGLYEFREHLGGELTITLLDLIGCGVEGNEIDASLVVQSVSYLRDRHHVG